MSKLACIKVNRNNDKHTISWTHAWMFPQAVRGVVSQVQTALPSIRSRLRNLCLGFHPIYHERQHSSINTTQSLIQDSHAWNITMYITINNQDNKHKCGIINMWPRNSAVLNVGPRMPGWTYSTSTGHAVSGSTKYNKGCPQVLPF